MDHTLEFLSQLLDQFIKNQFGLTDNKVVIGRVINQDGSTPVENENKLVLSLVNFSTETTMGSNDTRMGFASGGFSKTQAPMNLSMDVLFASNFSNEREGLKFLSKVVEFFHEQPNIDRNLFSDMPESLEKINLEIRNLSIQDSAALWSAIGAKAIPSVLYKVRVITKNP